MVVLCPEEVSFTDAVAFVERLGILSHVHVFFDLELRSFINRQGCSRRGTLRQVWICIAACPAGQLPVAILLPTLYRPRWQESLMTATNLEPRIVAFLCSLCLSASDRPCKDLPAALPSEYPGLFGGRAAVVLNPRFLVRPVKKG